MARVMVDVAGFSFLPRTKPKTTRARKTSDKENIQIVGDSCRDLYQVDSKVSVLEILQTAKIEKAFPEGTTENPVDRAISRIKSHNSLGVNINLKPVGFVPPPYYSSTSRSE